MKPEHVWPVGLAVVMLIVVLVNIGFIWLAVTNAPEVAEDYLHSDRR